MSEWMLDDLKIERQTYGEHKGKYTGRIQFVNGEHERFIFNLTQEDCAKYLVLISDKVVDSAKELSVKLIESMVVR